MRSGKSNRRPNRTAEHNQGGRTIKTVAPALALSISFFAALSAWRLASAPPHYGNAYSQISQRKPIIRTHPLSETGSDYMGLVREAGVEFVI